MKKKLLIGGLVLAFAGGAFAQMRARIDANGDGIITREEARGHASLEQTFDQIDANKDGKLSLEERTAFRTARKSEVLAKRKERIGANFKKLDGNGDGSLTKEELAKRPALAGNFAAIDGNHDGKVTLAELQAYKPPRGAAMK